MRHGAEPAEHALAAVRRLDDLARFAGHVDLGAGRVIERDLVDGQVAARGLDRPLVDVDSADEPRRLAQAAPPAVLFRDAQHL